ncbi:MAG: tripartite tricarboxylate transporter substrate-binding protein, partial [Pseudomonadota bacterium]
MTSSRRVVASCLLALAALMLPHSTHAQNYPNRAINYIVPSSPGSSPDIVGRIMAEALAKILGQPVVVLNRAGAGGTIAAAVTAKADPDGYTVLQANANHAFSHTLYKNLSYDLEKDFVPVGRFASAFYI